MEENEMQGLFVGLHACVVDDGIKGDFGSTRSQVMMHVLVSFGLRFLGLAELDVSRRSNIVTSPTQW